jgi:hypothetical protein
MREHPDHRTLRKPKPRVGNMRWRLLEIEERRRQRQKLLDNTQ